MMSVTDRSERVLALLLLQSLREEPQRVKIAQLNLAGFSNFEIAEMLETTGAVVSQTLYSAKSATKKRKAKKANAARAK